MADPDDDPASHPHLNVYRNVNTAPAATFVELTFEKNKSFVML